MLFLTSIATINNTQRYVFGFFAFCFVVVAGHHLYELWNPRLRPDYPPARHLVFVFINFLLALLMLKRHKYYLPFLLLIAVQQLYGHGMGLYHSVSNAKPILYTDLVIVVLVPMLALIYSSDVLKKKRIR